MELGADGLVLQAVGFISGIIMLLNLWASVRHNRPVDWDKDMSYVDKCMGLMELAEERWSSGGRFWDILNQLRWIPVDETHLHIVYPPTSSVRDQPHPPPPQNARAHHGYTTHDSVSPPDPAATHPGPAPTPSGAANQMYYDPQYTQQQPQQQQYHGSIDEGYRSAHSNEMHQHWIASSFGGLDERQLMQASQSLAQSYSYPYAGQGGQMYAGIDNYQNVVTGMMNSAHGGVHGNGLYVVLLLSVRVLMRCMHVSSDRLMDAFYGGKLD